MRHNSVVIRHNSVVIDTTHGFIHFLHSTRQAKSASSGTSCKPQDVLILDIITVPPMTTKAITAFLITYRNGVQQVP